MKVNIRFKGACESGLDRYLLMHDARTALPIGRVVIAWQAGDGEPWDIDAEALDTRGVRYIGETPGLIGRPCASRVGISQHGAGHGAGEASCSISYT